MTPEEKEELRERLDKAGIPHLGKNSHSLSKMHYVYGLTTEEYLRMLDKQNGNCAICEEHWGSKLVIDHNHKTGKIRGLICERCNRFVGYIENHPTLIPKIKKYLSFGL